MGIGVSRRPRLIPQTVFLRTLLPPQASPLSAQSEKAVATLNEADEKVLSMDPDHEDAKRSLIFNSLMSREYDHAVDLIEASQRGEDPDRILRALVASRAPGFFGPVTDRLIDRKSWDLALSLLELWETYRPAATRAKRGDLYLLTGQPEEARRVHDELIASCKTGEGCALGDWKPQEFFEHFGTQIKLPQFIHKTTPSYTDAAIKAKIRGVLLCSVEVEVDGTISNYQVIKGLGYGLDESALRELPQWRCAPGTLNGKPIRVRATIKLTFDIR